MKTRKTYKYRLYKSKRDKHLHRQINVAGLIWNHCIALHRRCYALTGQYISKYTLSSHILKLRRTTHRHWQQLGSQACQDVVERIDKAYQRFFAYCKHGGVRAGRPSFKKIAKYKSYTLKQAAWKLLGANKLRLHNHTYEFVKHREINGDIKTVTIKRDNLNRLWVYFSVIEDVPEPTEASTGKIGGFDFGLKIFLTSDEGHTTNMPEYFKSGMNKIARLNRVLSRKEKGSQNRQKARKQLARAYDKVKNQRREAHFKLAHQLCDRYDVMFFEDLNIAAMKRLWGRKVSDLGFAQFMQILQWVAYKRGKHVLFISRWEPTSKVCSDCGCQQALTLADRWFDCPECGLSLDRDHNAARNILRVGTTTHDREDVRQGCLLSLPEVKMPLPVGMES